MISAILHGETWISGNSERSFLGQLIFYNSIIQTESLISARPTICGQHEVLLGFAEATLISMPSPPARTVCSLDFISRPGQTTTFV